MTFRDELFFLAVTTYMESGGEPEPGRLAVASVIINRVKKAGLKSVFDIVLAPMQFSCWNSDSPTRGKLDTMDELAFEQCYASACAAYFGLALDPTGGATHYLNEAATRAGRPKGDLPSWFDEAKVTVRIGKHTFLKGV